MEWYIFHPADTLFFRGTESLEMGMDHFATTLFPPPISVLYGAVRSTILREKGINPKSFAENKADEHLYKALGRPAQSLEELPFTIYGPFFWNDGKVFVPAPLLWYGVLVEDDGHRKKIRVRYLKPIAKEIPIRSSKPLLWQSRGSKDKIVSLNGKWVELTTIFRTVEDTEIEIFSDSHFFVQEPRTGLALSRARKARTGHLYSLSHVRLIESFSLCLGIAPNPGLQEQGILFLGGENRFVRYKKHNLQFTVDTEGKKEGYFFAYTPIPAIGVSRESLVVTEKLQYRGGWDLAKGFHKPIIAHFPAGSVFKSRISKHCLPIGKQEDHNEK